jgi:mono/diheme cytochrome c family protein
MKKVLKWAGIILGVLVLLLVVAGVILAINANRVFKPTLSNRPLYPIVADTSPAGLERGKYLIEQVMDCTDACHTPENGKPLTGHYESINQGPISGVMAFPNLTSDVETGLGGWTDAEIARAIREGVDKNGVGLVLMPSHNYVALSDQDVAAVVGYLRSLEPVNSVIPPFQLNVAGKVLLSLGMLGPSPVQPPITAPKSTPPAGTPEYGGYLVKLGACSDCHGPQLAGGPLPFSEPGAVPAANLTPAGELVGWSEQDFIKAVREGVKPSGKALAEDMPRYGTHDEDLAAIFAYLKTVPPAQPQE